MAALDSATELARSNKFLLSEALCVKARVKVAAGATSGLHWDEYECKRRTAEVLGRMSGPGELHAKLMGA